ncbi:MAG: hypothetical protein MPN21_01645 [Thermoanaerobaculia bacterium]|nr:hypothetical protein [Thermoanaerobaculia bacterium]
MTKSLRPILLLVATTLASAASLYSEGATVEPTADDILTAYVEAAGGFASLDAVRSLRRSGALTLEGALTGVVRGRIEIVIDPRKRIRTATDLGAFSTTTAWDGTSAWESGPAGFRWLQGEELEGLRGQSDLLMAIELTRSPDHRAIRLEDREIDGTSHYALRVERRALEGEDGSELMTLYLDQDTGLLTQAVVPVTIPGVGDLVAVMDYRQHEAIVLPDAIGLAIEGVYSLEMAFDETVLDGPIDDQDFTPPKDASR